MEDLPVVLSVVTELEQEYAEELSISKLAIQEWEENYATELREDLKPDIFPDHLFKFVADDYKPKVKLKWNSFYNERLLTLISQIELLDIEKSTPGRALEEPIVRAQCYSWLDRYGHPDPDNPPRIKGHECPIELLDSNIKPIRTKIKSTNVLEGANMYQ